VHRWRGPILLAFLVALLFAVAVAWLAPLGILYRPRERVAGDWRLRPIQRTELRASSARSWFYRLSAIAFSVGVLLLVVFGAVNFGTLNVGVARFVLSLLGCNQ
jgi:hypothetical protein